MIAGTVQLLALDVISGDVIAAWWPLLVVLLGVSLLTDHWRRRRRVPSIGADDFDHIGVFGGTERRVTSLTFQGGTATAVLGGVGIDLWDAAVDEPPAVVTAAALFGGIDLKVLEEWVVATDVLPVFGAVEEDRRRPATDAERTGEADLIVTGFVTFGGTTITRVPVTHFHPTASGRQAIFEEFSGDPEPAAPDEERYTGGRYFETPDQPPP